MYFIGIDGGGTKTTFSMCDASGNLLAEVTKPTSHYLQCGFDGLTSIVREGIENLLQIQQCSRKEIACVFFGCPGYGDIETDTALISSAFDKAVAELPHSIGNDCENAFSGALAGRDGINLISGTGSIGFGCKAGKTARSGGWHHLLGSDEGSGYWFGMQMVHEFTRQSDGRTPKTELYFKMKEALSLKTDDEIIQRVVMDWNMNRTQIASLAPMAAELFDLGDAFVIQLFETAADELSKIALSISQQLSFEQGTIVSYTGGVFRMGQRILLPLERILSQYGLILRAPVLPPAKGSLLLALKGGGILITDEIVSHLAK